MLSLSGLGDIVAMRHHLDVPLICATLRIKTPYKRALLEKYVPTTALVNLPFLIKGSNDDYRGNGHSKQE